jgi:hypothetical protein
VSSFDVSLCVLAAVSSAHRFHVLANSVGGTVSPHSNRMFIFTTQVCR